MERKNTYLFVVFKKIHMIFFINCIFYVLFLFKETNCCIYYGCFFWGKFNYKSCLVVNCA